MSPLARRTSVHPAGSGGGRGVVGHNVGTFLQRARSGRGCSARASARDRAVAAQGGLASLCRLPGIIAALSTPAVGTRSSWASASESDDGTRLSFPSTDPGREVFQPNVVVVSVTGGLHSPLVVSVAPALPSAGLHARLLRVHPGRPSHFHVNAVHTSPLWRTSQVDWNAS